MRFGPWYALHEATAHAPAEAGTFQLRRAEGLVDYPRGRSAMLRYGAAADVCARLTDIAAAYTARLGDDELVVWARHLTEVADPGAFDHVAYVGELLGEFVRRFGAPPADQPSSSASST